MNPPLTFGQWLFQRRKALNLTRAELAQRVGCSVSALRKVEDGERRPSLQIAALLAKAIDIPADERPAFLRVARGELTVDRLSAAPLAPVAVRPTSRNPHVNVPSPATPLIGREPELAALVRLLSDPDCRLITVVGPGGIGKTRLAIEAASVGLQKSARGVYFIPLAPINSSEFIAPAIADALGFAFLGPSEPKTQLLNYLRATKRDMLLVLDNFEHLLDGAGLLAEILQRTSGVKLLITSRERLSLGGEWALELHGLPVPPEEPGSEIETYSAAVMFARSAQRARLGFVLSDQNRAEVARICRLVDGMPLGIELAAAWTHVLTCQEIAQEVERSLDFLASRQRDVPERHRSLRAVFDHSWSLLTEVEQRAQSRLVVFRGGFDREAAEKVAQASLATLSSLVSKSLVQRTEAGRYDLHELLRQYAATHLEADPAAGAAARQQHYAFYLAVAEAAEARLRGSSQMEALSQLAQEHDNLRAALEWSLADGQADDSALRLAGALRWFWQIRSNFHEGRSWLTKALEKGSEGRAASQPLLPLASVDSAIGRERLRARACALEGLALLTNSLGNHSEAHALAEQSLEICRELGDKHGQADALMVVGQTLRWQGEAALSHARLEEALALYRGVGDRWNVARSLFSLGTYLADFGGNAAGRAMLEESSAILEELGDRFVLISLLVSLGITAMNLGDYAAARTRFDRSLAIAQEVEDPWGMADALTNIGCILRIQGDYAAARKRFEDALRMYEEGGRGIWCTDPLCALAENDIAQGNLSDARLHLQNALASSQASENTWLQSLVGYFQGLLAYYEGDWEGATKRLEIAVALARASQYKPDLARSLVTLGRALAARGERARASAPRGLESFWGKRLQTGHGDGTRSPSRTGPVRKHGAHSASARQGRRTSHVDRRALAPCGSPRSRPGYRSCPQPPGRERVRRSLEAGTGRISRGGRSRGRPGSSTLRS